MNFLGILTLLSFLLLAPSHAMGQVDEKYFDHREATKVMDSINNGSEIKAMVGKGKELWAISRNGACYFSSTFPPQWKIQGQVFSNTSGNLQAQRLYLHGELLIAQLQLDTTFNENGRYALFGYKSVSISRDKGKTWHRVLENCPDVVYQEKLKLPMPILTTFDKERSNQYARRLNYWLSGNLGKNWMQIDIPQKMAFFHSNKIEMGNITLSITEEGKIQRFTGKYMKSKICFEQTIKEFYCTSVLVCNEKWCADILSYRNKIYLALNPSSNVELSHIGLYCSLDTGETWKKVEFLNTVNLHFNQVYTSNKIIALATNDGLFFSLDGGGTWKKEPKILGAANTIIGNNGKIYCGVSKAHLKSENNTSRDLTGNTSSYLDHFLRIKTQETTIFYFDEDKEEWIGCGNGINTQQ
ncbi:MAG: WD40/YVTN/BNR-like repeat-containing protein [Candidatus Kapaibacteriota bacterium]|jgi:hypothetical protein